MSVGTLSPRVGAGAVLCVCVALGAAAPSQGKPPAPGAPGAIHTWAPADKHGFGTARQLTSPAYFTLRRASLTEVYYPDLSTPGFRGLQFAVSDGKTFLDRETVDDDPRHIEPVAPGVTARVTPLKGSLGFRQVTRTARWRLTKTWITDPNRATVLARVRFRSLTGKPLRLFVLADPAPGDDGNDDQGTSTGTTLVASDDAGATVVAANPPLTETSSGYRGTASDPWTDLADGRLHTYDATQPGNVVQAARLRANGTSRRTVDVALGLGATPSAARGAAGGSLAAGFDRVAARYAKGWSGYRAKLPAAPKSAAGMKGEYDASLFVLAASEDKHHPGAFVASPTMPWDWGQLTLEKPKSGPYHLVWPRDTYQMATALLAAGDKGAANRAVDFMFAHQQRPDGSLWQNTEVDGTPHWTGTQMDEVSFPVILAHQLGRDDLWPRIKLAADYVVAHGPQTDQDRWENNGGYVPGSIASEIAALVCAADVAQRKGDAADAKTYRDTADAWQRQVQGWTATTNGPYSPKPYYLRLTKDGMPDQGTTYNLGDGGPSNTDQRKVVDPSFLELVRLGVKPANDPVIANSLNVVDQQLRVDTPNGTFWHRYSFDGYGETRTGEPWRVTDDDSNLTLGRAWPIFAGERGEYELLRGADASPRLRAIAATANDGGMIAEQVWDGRPPTGTGGRRAGTGTLSATPLAWSHAQLIRLAWSIQKGRPVEQPAIVACRYAGRCPGG
jgi:glucoamylase